MNQKNIAPDDKPYIPEIKIQVIQGYCQKVKRVADNESFKRLQKISATSDGVIVATNFPISYRRT